MATNYLYGTVLTSGEQVAANNRGDTLGGNTTTLQKIFLGEDVHTTVSAEAIRFALRYRFQLQGLNVNRKYVYDRGKYELRYRSDADEKREYWKVEQDEKSLKYVSKGKDDIFIDDDIMEDVNRPRQVGHRGGRDLNLGRRAESPGRHHRDDDRCQHEPKPHRVHASLRIVSDPLTRRRIARPLPCRRRERRRGRPAPDRIRRVGALPTRLARARQRAPASGRSADGPRL